MELEDTTLLQEGVDSFLHRHLLMMDRVLMECEIDVALLMGEIEDSLEFVSLRRKQRLRALVSDDSAGTPPAST